MPENPVIRVASLDDYESVCTLLDGLDELHQQKLPWLFQTPASPPRSPEYFGQLLTSNDSTVFVASVGEIVGVAIVLMRTAPAFPVFIPQRWAVLVSMLRRLGPTLMEQRGSN